MSTRYPHICFCRDGGIQIETFPVLLLLLLLSSLTFAPLLRVFFYKLDEIGNSENIGIREFIKSKKSNKMYPQWVLTSDSKTNTLLSELIWHVLLKRSLNFCACTTSFLDLDDLIEHDYVRTLKSQYYKQMPS